MTEHIYKNPVCRHQYVVLKCLNWQFSYTFVHLYINTFEVIVLVIIYEVHLGTDPQGHRTGKLTELWEWKNRNILNKPGVAGDVLQTALSLIH